MRISFSSPAALMVGLSMALATVPLIAAQEDDAAKVRALETKWTDSYKQRKIDILASLLAEDFSTVITKSSASSDARKSTFSCLYESEHIVARPPDPTSHLNKMKSTGYVRWKENGTIRISNE